MSIATISTKERPVKEVLRSLIREEGTTIESVAQSIGKSRSALSRYLNGDYPAKTIEPLVKDYLTKLGKYPDEPITEVAPGEPPKGGWIKSVTQLEIIRTEDMERVWGMCRLCYADGNPDRTEMGVLTGEPGTGKTLALNEYRKRHNSRAVIITCDATSTKKSVLVDTAEALNIGMTGTAATLMRRIVKHLQRTRKLLIYDEADLIKNPVVFETIRAIHDKSKAGVLFCGNHVLAERILFYAEERSELARLRDRIGYTEKLEGITWGEVRELTRRLNATDKARILLVNIGTKRGTRQLVKALGRLLDVTQGTVIDEELVQDLGEILLSFNA